MRRSDREIVAQNEITEILEACDSCRIGLNDGEYPYILPLNFGYEWNGALLHLYFHGAKVGKKIDLICQNQKASFQMDCNHTLIKNEAGCKYTMKSLSVMGQGTIEVVTEMAEKITALSLLMKQYEKERTFTFTPEQADRVAVIKLTVHSYTAKNC